jgi:hypothetical protein
VTSGSESRVRPVRPSLIMCLMERDGGDGLLGWYVVANIAREIAHGDAGLDVQRGLKHFAPGAKEWVPRPPWDPGDGRMPVVGRHRGNTRRYVNMVVRREDLENFRAKGVYSLKLLRSLNSWCHDLTAPTKPQDAWPSREAAQEWADAWNSPLEIARLDGRFQPYVAVPNPPPAELEVNGRTYYLAHYSARGPRYSSEAPPRELAPQLP